MKKQLLTPLMLLSVTANASFLPDFSSVLEGARQTIIENKYAAIAGIAGVATVVGAYRYLTAQPNLSQAELTNQNFALQPTTVAQTPAQESSKKRRPKRQIFAEFDDAIEPVQQVRFNDASEVNIIPHRSETENYELPIIQPMPLVSQPEPVQQPVAQAIAEEDAELQAAIALSLQSTEQVIPQATGTATPSSTPKTRPTVAPKPRRADLKKNMEQFVTDRTAAQPEQVTQQQSAEEPNRAALRERMARLRHAHSISEGIANPIKNEAPIAHAAAAAAARRTATPADQQERLAQADATKRQALQANAMHEAQQRARQIAERNAAKFADKNNKN